MGFKLPGKSIHSGTSSHKSAVKMYKDAAPKMYNDSPADMALKGDQHKLPQHLQDGIEAAPEPGSSPNKVYPLVVAGGLALARTAGGQIIKKGVQKGSQNLIKSLSTGGIGSNLKNKAIGYGKTLLKQGAIYAGLDQAVNYFSGDDDKKQKTTNTVTPPKTTKKKKSNGSYSRAKKNDPNLESYIAGRKKHKKGSSEYNAFQNKINKAYGSKTRHGVETSSSTKGRKSSSMTSTPGLGTRTMSKTRQKDGDVKLSKSTFSDDRGVTTKKTRTKRGVFSDKVRSEKSKFVTTAAPGSDLADKKTKIKTRYTKSGDVKSNKRVTKQDGMRTVTKTNRRGKTTTKTRKTLNPFD